MTKTKKVIKQQQKYDKEIIEAIEVLVDYDYDAEKKHYLENGKPAGHVYRSIRTLELWLKKIKK